MNRGSIEEFNTPIYLDKEKISKYEYVSDPTEKSLNEKNKIQIKQNKSLGKKLYFLLINKIGMLTRTKNII